METFLTIYFAGALITLIYITRSKIDFGYKGLLLICSWVGFWFLCFCDRSEQNIKSKTLEVMDRQEAIKIVKSNLPEGRQMLSEALEFLIPELKKSEDENIQEWIIGILKALDKDSRIHINLNPEMLPLAISWLEKQGEKKPVEWSEKDEIMLDDTCRILSKAKECTTSNISWLKALSEKLSNVERNVG